MNILFYQFGINPLKGGVQRVSYNIAKQLKLQGDKVYAVYKDDDAFTENLRNAFEDCLKINSLDDSAFIKLVKFSRTCKVNIIINQCGFSISDTKFLSKLKKECNIRLYSFIHISPTGSRDVLQFRDFRFPKLVLRSLAKEFMFIFYKADKWKYKRVYKLSDKVVLLSESFITDFKQIICNEDINHKIAAIPNCITYPLQDESVLQKKENILLVVTRMGETQKKNFPCTGLLENAECRIRKLGIDFGWGWFRLTDLQRYCPQEQTAKNYIHRYGRSFFILYESFDFPYDIRHRRIWHDTFGGTTIRCSSNCNGFI